MMPLAHTVMHVAAPTACDVGLASQNRSVRPCAWSVWAGRRGQKQGQAPLTRGAARAHNPLAMAWIEHHVHGCTCGAGCRRKQPKPFCTSVRTDRLGWPEGLKVGWCTTQHQYCVCTAEAAFGPFSAFSVTKLTYSVCILCATSCL